MTFIPNIHTIMMLKKFMDEIVDIDRANVFTKADIVDILNKIRADVHYNAEMHEDKA